MCSSRKNLTFSAMRCEHVCYALKIVSCEPVAVKAYSSEDQLNHGCIAMPDR